MSDVKWARVTAAQVNRCKNTSKVLMRWDWWDAVSYVGVENATLELRGPCVYDITQC